MHDVHLVPFDFMLCEWQSTLLISTSHISTIHISTHSFGPSAMNYFGYKQLGTVHIRQAVVKNLTLTEMPLTTSKPQNYAGSQS